MADETPKDNSPKTEPTHVETNEDAETRATRRELKQSSISDEAKASTAVNGDDKAEDPSTPTPDTSIIQTEEETVLSPKKKRSHDQLGEDKGTDDNDATSTTSTDSAKDRASRLEPEKKRHREAEAGSASSDQSTSAVDSKQLPPSSSPAKKDVQTSASAFAASGFGSLSSASSPFAALGNTKGSGFGAAAGAPVSSFASPPPASNTPSTEAPKLTFGGASGSVSPFGGLGSKPSNGFGSAFGSGGSAFGSALSGIKPLGNFAAPGSQPLAKGKPAKPFGAPDSDAEDDGSDEEADGDSQPEEGRAASPEKESEEKKKLKLQKVEVNDGESGEATIVSVRAKVFYYHDKEVGWKERGAGMLKINVPEACVEFDDAGVPVPGSFDASGLELGEKEGEKTGKGHKVARLILRQDQTHRVILNTAILPAMKFEDKASLKSVGILFTAFEGDDAKPVNITVKMTAANAKIFMSELGIVQKELQSS